MLSTLLSTKLFIPPIQSEYVPRSRLVQQLIFGQRTKLTLISAPAGFGKTTLLSEWARVSPIPVVWVSLDEGDNDLIRLLSYILAAVRKIEPSLGEKTLSLLHGINTPIDALVTPLINDIANLSTNFSLVLDDYHVINSENIHQFILNLLDYLPPQLHLVIATRIDPPFPIARLRGRGQLTEIRLADLRFNLGETITLLHNFIETELPSEDISKLASHTEGWVAGLQMASIAMRSLGSGREPPSPQDDAPQPNQTIESLSSFINNFTGSNRYIMDYLVEEVLDRQPSDIQSFLIQTSILDRLAGSLCNAVTEQTDSQEILERLEQANLFLVHLDDKRGWYRYHTLFSDLLRHRLNHLQPGKIHNLHKRASTWYEQHAWNADHTILNHELTTATIQHALSAGNIENAASLIEQASETILMRSELTTLLNWLDKIPETIMHARPTLNLYHAWALIITGKSVDEVEIHLDEIEAKANAETSEMATLRAYIAILKGQMPEAAKFAYKAIDILPKGTPFFRGIAAYLLGFSYIIIGDIQSGSQALNEAVQICHEMGNIFMAVRALCYLAELRAKQARLHEAEMIYQKALDLAIDQNKHTLPIGGWVMISISNILYEWNELQKAENLILNNLELTKLYSETAVMDGYLTLARIKQAQGDTQAANLAIKKAKQVANKTFSFQLDDMVCDMHQARIWIMQGNIDAAHIWAQELLDQIKSIPRNTDAVFRARLRKYEYVIIARVLIAQKQCNEARSILEPLLIAMKKEGRMGLVIETQILLALACQVQDDLPQALSYLESALSHAQPENFIRIFLNEGEPMRDLLKHASKRQIQKDYVNKLLSLFEPGSSLPEINTYLEQLSVREIEVLRLLLSDMSSTEISQELFIATSTTRSHIKNIYSKLNVHGRIEAIQRAKQLKII